MAATNVTRKLINESTIRVIDNSVPLIDPIEHNLSEDLEYNQMQLKALKPYRIEYQPDDIVGLQFDASAKFSMVYMLRDFYNLYGDEFKEEPEDVESEPPKTFIIHDMDPSLPYIAQSKHAKKQRLRVRKTLKSIQGHRPARRVVGNKVFVINTEMPSKNK